MMRYLALVFIYIFFLGKVYSGPDPKATKWLKKVESVYNSFSSLKIDLTIETKPAEHKTNIQSGSFAYQGSSFSLILPDHEVYFDGKTQYTYFKDRKEVQITSSKEEDAVYHPKFFAGLYKSGKYEYKIESEDSKFLTIEFVPIERTESFFKVKIKIRKTDVQMTQLQIFEKNGDRITINNKKIVSNAVLNSQKFTMESGQLKGLHVEDLRDE